MNNLATFIVSLLMVYTARAQSPVNWPNYIPFISSAYYYHNHQVLPTQQNAPVVQQNTDQHVLHRDAMMSVVLRELKETKIVVENVKKEMADLENELAQIKQTADEKTNEGRFRNEWTETKPQIEILPTTFENYTAADSRSIGKMKSSYCSCKTFHETTDGLSKELAETQSQLNALTAQFQASLTPTTIDQLPTSCADLKQLGYKNSGIFSIKGNKQVESVYCDFTKSSSDADFQTWIGIEDIKTTRVAFHAQRGTSYTISGSPIPFDLLRTNVGNGMGESNGIFTAPVTGTYFFGFAGTTLFSSNARIELQKKTATDDWFNIGKGYGSVGLFETYAMQATLHLHKGNQIRLFLVEGKIYDSDRHNTNFVGFLLEEELFQVSAGK